jgi:hypothetical protein
VVWSAINDDSFTETYDTQATEEFRKATTRKQYEEMGRRSRRASVLSNLFRSRVS